MKSIFISLVFVFLNIYIVNAQKNECLSDFDFLVNKVKADYPGYNDKVPSLKSFELFTLELIMRKKMSSYPDSCLSCMEEYVSFFKDPHLRVYRIAENTIQKDRKVLNVSSYGKNISLNSDSLYENTINSLNIEGIWTGFSDEFAVIKKEDGNGYIGLLLNSKDWNKYQVKYEFTPTNHSDYNIIEHTLLETGKPVFGKASLFLSGKVLEIHDKTQFVRKSDSALIDKALLYSYSPVYPNQNKTYWLATYLSDSTFYLRLPSFGSEKTMNLVTKNWEEIISRPNLIIDIRNNGGGQDTYYQKLLTLLYTKPYLVKGVEWYASEGNIKMFEDALKNGQILNGEEGIKWTNSLIEEMKKNKGGFVIHPLMGKDKIIKYDTVYRYPKRIGVIIHERNGSSAEQFILTAKQSEKVLLFGDRNTAGVLDYSNGVPTILPSGKYQLYSPMTRSRRLPDNPIDNKGIAPDIRIPYPATKETCDRLDSWRYFVNDRLDNWVYFVMHYLELKEK